MTETEQTKNPWIQKFQPFDWICLGGIILLSSIIGGIIISGEKTPFKVSHFSWANKKVGLQDKVFTLKFNRPVNSETVEKNLTIEPPLPGKMSWQGRELIYTLEDPPIYGTNYQIKLENIERTYDLTKIEPFVSLFSTRDRVLAYIGLQGEEKGRLILYNITDINQTKKTILTPRDLIVTDFKIYPNSDKILFSAFEPNSGGQALAKQQLYSVTTGFNNEASMSQSQRAGKLEIILNAQDYQNLKFDLSKNGKTIVVERKNYKNPADSGLWVIPQGEKPRPLGVPGGEFMVSPDGQRLVVTQQGGIGIIPLTPEAGSPQFLPDYQTMLGFSHNGQKILLLKDNGDYTRSLVWVDPNGKPQQILRSLYPIIDCEIEPREESTLYCIKTDLVDSGTGQYREEPFLAVINLKTKTDIPLLALPNYRDVKLSMSPDGVALLFDQVVTGVSQSDNDLMTLDQQAIADGQLWLLPLPELKTRQKSVKISPEELNRGFKPQWLP